MQLNIASLLAENSGNPGRKLTEKEMRTLTAALDVASKLYEQDRQSTLAKAASTEEYNATLPPLREGERRQSPDVFRSLANQYARQHEEVCALRTAIDGQHIYLIDADDEVSF